MKTVEWHEVADAPTGAEVWLIDQTKLPQVEEVVHCRDYQQVAHAIRSMQVRGAPAIGVTAAMGVALAGLAAPGDDAGFWDTLNEACETLAKTRPTAVNLFWAIQQMRAHAETLRGRPVGEIKAALVEKAQHLAAEDERACRAIGEHGLALFAPGDGVLTHCNAGALACVAYGTALSPLLLAKERDVPLHVFVDETRPFLQGARLTAWELHRAGIDSTLITDNMAAYFMGQHKVQKVIVGADRIAANGDVANKIGTYGLAILAQAHGIPFYVAAPTSTIDLSLPSGEHIPIEERDPTEVTQFRGLPVAPRGMSAAHPAFDVTPHRYVTAIITEVGVLAPPFAESLRQAVNKTSPPPGTGPLRSSAFGARIHPPLPQARGATQATALP